jgi:hypothetical protein
MIFNQTSATGTSAQIPPRDYPAPPCVHWIVLFGASIVVDVLAGLYIPERYHTLTESLFVDAWVFYLSLWIRSLDENARSPFWCDAYVVVELTLAVLSAFPLAIWRDSPSPLAVAKLLLAFASLTLGILAIFLIRSDLERHYNEREPLGLHLSGMMTFFFSIYYFQYHLYKIAQLKEGQAGGDLTDSTRSSIP